MPFALISSELPILTKLVGEIWSGETGRGQVVGHLDEPAGAELDVLPALDFFLPDLGEVPPESGDLAGDKVD